MAEEILIKYKADMTELDSDYKAIIATDAKVRQTMETPIKFSGVDELKSALKLIAAQSKEINFKTASAEIDNLVNDSTKLKALIDSLSKSMKGMEQGTKEFKAMDSIIQSANKQLATLGKTSEKTGETLRSQNRQAIQDVQKLIDKFGEFDKRTIAAAKSAANIGDKIGDAKQLIDAFNPDTKFQGVSAALSGVAAGFGALQGAMALVGGESEEMNKALVKVQTAMNLSQAISQLGQAGGAFTALRAQAVASLTAIRTAIGLTGIGAIAIALGAVVAYWDDIKEAVTGVDRNAKKLSETAEKDLEIQEGKIKKLGEQDEVLKLQGKSEREILVIKQQALVAINKQKLADLGRILETEREELLSYQRRVERNVKLGIISAKEGISSELQGKIDSLRALTGRVKTAQSEVANQEAKLTNEIKAIDQKDANDKAKRNSDALTKAQQGAKDLAAQVKKDNDEYFKDFNEQQKYKTSSSDEYYKKEEANLERIGETANARNEYNKKKGQERADELIKNAKNLFKITTQIDQDAEKEAKRLAQEKEDRLKAQIQLIGDFAKKGILLEIGINPESVARIQQSVEGAFEAFKTGSKATSEDKAKAAADVLGNTYSAVSDAIRESDRRESARKLEELNAQQEEEIRLAGENEQKKEVIKQKYELKRKELKRKEAQADKEKAIFDIVVNTAVSVAKSLASPFLIPFIIGLGAAQLALVTARPLPKFEKGGRVKDGLLRGAPHSAGGIAIEAEGDEYIVNKHSTQKHLGLIDAINKDNAQEYLDKHIVLPAIQKKEAEIAQKAISNQLNYENNIINKAMAKTLNEIKRGNEANTDKIVRAVSQQNYGL